MTKGLTIPKFGVLSFHHLHDTSTVYAVQVQVLYSTLLQSCIYCIYCIYRYLPIDAIEAIILSFYLLFYDFFLFIFLYFCVVNTEIFFHLKFFIFQCSVRGQAKGRLCRAGEGGSLAICD